MKRLSLIAAAIASAVLCVSASGTERFLKLSGGSSGGNATVPNNAPIQPPQAFVDSIRSLVNTFDGSDLVLSNKGITYFAPELLYDGNLGVRLSRFDISTVAGFGGGAGIRIVNLSGNALSEANVNSLLAVCAAFQNDSGGLTGTLDLSGGTNSAPTGQGLTDKAFLIDNGWTVTTN